MTWLDYAVIGVLVLSIAWGVWRGLVREVMSLTGWVIAFLAANLLAAPLADSLPSAIHGDEYRTLLAFSAIFVIALVLTSVTGVLLRRFMKAVGLDATDRMLGGVFGLARGLLIAVAFAVLAGLTALPRQPVWTQSVLGPPLGRTVVQLKPWLPPALAERLRYH